jgi:hypothetical protein
MTASPKRTLALLPVLVALAPLAWPVRAAAESTPLSTTMSDAGFERIAIERGVVVYRDKRDRLIRIAADGRFEAPPAQVLRALLDYQRQVGILARLTEAHILARAPAQLVVYERVNMPVISDRDWVLSVRYGRRGQGYWLAFNALPERAAPASRKAVRVVFNEGSWQLEPIDGGRATRARFQVRIDLAGMVPRWLARASAGKELPEMFASVCRMLQAPRC